MEHVCHSVVMLNHAGVCKVCSIFMWWLCNCTFSWFQLLCNLHTAQLEYSSSNCT